MKNSTYEIVEVFYAENERQYRVVEKKPDGKIPVSYTHLTLPTIA